MSTDFLDALERQLETAARRRYRRPAPRRYLGGIALAVASVAAVVVAVVLLSGRGATHEAKTPAASKQPGTAAIGEAARGVPVTIIGRNPVALKRLAERLSHATGASVAYTDNKAPDLADTEVNWAPGYADAALAVSEFIGPTPSRLAATRVRAGVGASAKDKTPIIVRLGRTSAVKPGVTTPGTILPVTFRDGCPHNPRPLSEADIDGAAVSLVLAWPAGERAVPLSTFTSSGGVVGVDRDTRRTCGANLAARSAVVELQLTASPGDGPKVFAYVSREDHRYRVWRTVRLTP